MDPVALLSRHLQETKVYLNFVGIWPHQKKSSQYFIRTVIYGISLSCMVAKILHLVCFFDMDVLVDQLCGISILIMVLTKYGIHIVKGSEFKVLLDGMVIDVETHKTNEELDLMIPYMNKAVIMMLLYARTAVLCAFIIIFIQIWPVIADVIIPLNTSRPRDDLFPLYYYFIDTDDYLYCIRWHQIFALAIAVSVSVGCDTFYIYTVQHACGLFAIAGYRFKLAIKDIQDARKMSAMSNETYRNVCRSIVAHDRAIRHVREIDDFYDGILFVALGVTIVAFSCSLFWLTKLKSSTRFYVQMIYSLLEICHLLFLAVQGQFVNNRTDSIYYQIYEGQWYNSVPKTQALFILALRTAVDPPQITAGGVIAMNLRSFAEVVKLSFSYYTVLQST